MTFTPPSFKNLRVNTLNLDTKLSTLLGRYLIIEKAPSAPAAAAAGASALKVQSPLEVLIARTNQVLECKSNRETAKEVFTKLIVELREVLKENDEANMNQATMFLLGALLHRYFRIIKEYEDWTTRFYKPCALDCELFRAIRFALQFDPSVKKDEYKAKDLTIIDVTTIVHSLEVFKANMLVEDKFHNPRFKKYPHFANDPHFFPYLQEIINKYQTIGKDTLNQFKAIKFVQSLANKLETDRIQIEEELQKWSKSLMAEHPDFRKLTQESIEQHITKTIKSDALREKILDLLYTPHITSSLEKMDHKTFIEGMSSCYSDIARYTLFGGYTLLLQTEGINDQMKFCIRECLGVEPKQNEITKEDMSYGINFLSMLIEKEPNIVLNCDFFGGLEKLKTEVAQKKLELGKAAEEKEGAEGNAVVLI